MIKWSRLSSWVRRHFVHLKRWGEYAEMVVRAAGDILGDVRVYVIGGLATIHSDIDIPWS